MGLTTDKGEIGEAETIADLRRQGHAVAIPFGHSLPFDLVLVRGDNGALERVQVKYTTSDGRVIKVRCASYSAWVSYRYRASMVDWIAVFDSSTDQVYYIHSCEWDGLAMVNLRLEPTANNQATFIRWARNFQTPDCERCKLRYPEESPTTESRRGELNP